MCYFSLLSKKRFVTCIYKIEFKETYMKKIIFLLSIVILAACSTGNKKTSKSKINQDILNPSGFIIERGVNISHWLSQVYGFSQRDVFFTKEDVLLIDSLGFDHIRLPIDEKELWDEKGKPIPESFAYLRKAIQWCLEYDVRVIVDLHIIRSFYFNADNEGGKNTLFSNPKEQKKFFSLWKTLSDSLKQFPESMVAYELLNEAAAENPEDWNKLVEGGVKTIRALEPERVIIIGSNMWQITSTFPDLKVPKGDKNIILSFHNYDPLLFTHYTAEWTGFKEFKDSVNYPGQIITQEVYERNKHLSKNEGAHIFDEALQIYGPKRFEEIFKPAIEKAKELQLQLYCGEFGALPTTQRESRLQYYRDIIETFNKHGIAYTSWDYKGLFGIRKWDSEKNINTDIDVELTKILAQTEE